MQCIIVHVSGKYDYFTFFSLPAILNELISSGELAGSIHGRGLRAIFIPTVYSQMQSQWVDRFLDDNGYLGKRKEERKGAIGWGGERGGGKEKN